MENIENSATALAVSTANMSRSQKMRAARIRKHKLEQLKRNSSDNENDNVGNTALVAKRPPLTTLTTGGQTMASKKAHPLAPPPPKSNTITAPVLIADGDLSSRGNRSTKPPPQAASHMQLTVITQEDTTADVIPALESLAIAVTMSEDSNERKSHGSSGSSRTDHTCSHGDEEMNSHGSYDVDNSRNMSAWAMMAHYPRDDRDIDEYGLKSFPYMRSGNDDAHYNNPSLSAETEDSLQLDEAQVMMNDNCFFDSDEYASGRQNPTMDHPKNANAMVDAAVSSGVNGKDSDADIDIDGSDVSQGNYVEDDFSTEYPDSFPTVSAVHDKIHRRKSFRTPGRVRWQTNENGDLSPDEIYFTDSKPNLPRDVAYDSSGFGFKTPMSNLSGGTFFEEKKEWEVDDDRNVMSSTKLNTNEEEPSIETFSVEMSDDGNVNNTQLSFASLQASESGLGSMNMNGYVSAQHPSLALDVNKAQVANAARITELEQSLKAKDAEKAQEVEKLQERLALMELKWKEATTPRGTNVKTDPIQTLLDRNQTLTCEVRFAEQVCVELEGKFKAKSVENDNLWEQIGRLEKENEELRAQFEEDSGCQLTVIQERENESESSSEMSEKEIIHQLRRELIEANEKLRSMQEQSIDEGTIRGLVDDLRHEVGELANEREHSHDDDIDLSSALQEQVRRLKVKIRSECAAHETTLLELQEARGKIESLKANVRYNEQFSSNGLIQDLREEAETAKSRLMDAQVLFDAKETEWKTQAEEYLKKIESLQESLCQVNVHKYLYDDGPTSPRLKMADKSIAQLEKDLIHAKAEIVSWKRKTEFLINERESDIEKHKAEKSKIMGMMESALVQLIKKYDQLDRSVNESIHIFSDRSERIIENVAHLRESLDFETESVATQVRNDPGRTLQEDDTMLDIMEAGGGDNRSMFSDPNETFCSEGLSRLLVDDTTLASFKQAGPDTPMSEISESQVRECFEKAAKEYHQLRDQFARMKSEYENEIESQKFTIVKLESESGALSLQCHRQAQDKGDLVEKIDQAQKETETLQAKLEELASERDGANKSLDDLKRDMEVLMREKGEWDQVLEKAVQDINRYKGLLKSENLAKESTAKFLAEARSANEKAKRDIQHLKMQMAVNRAESNESRQAEVKVLQDSLADAQMRIEHLKHAERTLTEKMERVSEEKRKAEADVRESCRAHQEYKNFAEEQVMKANLEAEDMRKTHAAYRSKVASLESELKTSMNEFGEYKGRVASKLDEKRSAIIELRRLQSLAERREQQFVGMRRELIGYLTSAGVCSDVVNDIRAAESASNESYDQEIQYWREIIPAAGSMIVTLSQVGQRAASLEEDYCRVCANNEQLEANRSELLQKVSEEEAKFQKAYELLQRCVDEAQHFTLETERYKTENENLCTREREANEELEKARSELEKVHEESNITIAQIRTEREGAEKRAADASAAVQKSKEKFVAASKSLKELDEQKSQLAEALQAKESEMVQLVAKIESANTKCSRLREYGRKMEDKCIDWEKSYATQDKQLHKVTEKNIKMRQQLKEVVTKYKDLVDAVKRKSKIHKQDRARREAEQASIQNVQAQLEVELQQIIRELSMSNNNH